MAQRTSRQEYEAALAAYTKAKAWLIEAKQHYDPKTAPEVIEKRNAKAAEYRAKRKAARNAPEAIMERERHALRVALHMDEYERRRDAERRRSAG